MGKFQIYEYGNLVSEAETDAEWKRCVKGLNSSADCVDADYPEIIVKCGDKTVFHQSRTHVP